MKGLIGHLLRRTPVPVHSCEICASSGVERSGNWDYCPKGHVYVGERADEPDAPGPTHPDTAMLYRSIDVRR